MSKRGVLLRSWLACSSLLKGVTGCGGLGSHIGVKERSQTLSKTSPRAKLRTAFHANSDDGYWLRRARVRRLFFGFWARRNLYRQGCREDRGTPKRKDPDLRAWFGRARCEQCRSRPAFICDRIRRRHSRGGCSISRRRDAVPARRRFCRPLLRP